MIDTWEFLLIYLLILLIGVIVLLLIIHLVVRTIQCKNRIISRDEAIQRKQEFERWRQQCRSEEKMYHGYNLKVVRLKHEKTQSEIAEILQTTQQQYSKYEVGTQELPARHIIALANYYGVSADELLGITKSE